MSNRSIMVWCVAVAFGAACVVAMFLTSAETMAQPSLVQWGMILGSAFLIWFIIFPIGLAIRDARIRKEQRATQKRNDPAIQAALTAHRPHR